jgi:hypothetical protein
MAEQPPLHATELLKKLLAAEVDFVVIGGIALSLHGVDRNTKDLDISFARDKDNLERLGQLLVELNARLWGVDEDVPFAADARTFDGIQVLTLRTSLGLLDLLSSPAGAPRYSTLARKAERADFADGEISFASLDHLIAMKEASGRPQDLADIEALKAVKRLQRGDPARDSFGRTAKDVLREIDHTQGDG